jgi:hypothetical protein
MHTRFLREKLEGKRPLEDLKQEDKNKIGFREIILGGMEYVYYTELYLATNWTLNELELW